MPAEDLWNTIVNKGQHGRDQKREDIIEASQSRAGALLDAPLLPAVRQTCKPDKQLSNHTKLQQKPKTLQQKPKTRIVDAPSKPVVVEQQSRAVAQCRFQGK